jgi:hypothetical protein
MPLCGYYYPLGFPLSIATNSEDILAAAGDSWSAFSQRFGRPPLHLRVGVTEGGNKEFPKPSVRGQRHMISFIGDSENFSIADLDTGFAYCWLNTAVAQDRALLRYHYLDSVVLTLIDSMYVCTVHAACVALDGQGVLLCGASGAGKSTLAYACARDGWQYVSDDASSLVKGRMDRMVIGNPHRLRLRPDAALIFPELHDRLVTPRANGKVSIEIDMTAERQIDRLCECQIRYIVFLDRTAGATASLTSYPKDQALNEMASVICYGSPEHRETRISHYKNLLEVPVMQMRYESLEDAVDCLTGMVRGR